jgi:hypothetical protein
MRWLVATALLARSAAADPAIDYQRAKLHALTAHNLAHDGHCAEALALRPRIESLDAEVARVAYSEDPMLLACEHGPNFAPPSLTPTVAPAPASAPPRTGCSTRTYLEPSLLLLSGGGDPTVFNRIAAGALIRGCTSPFQVRVGATMFFGSIGNAGVGGELEVNHTLSEDTRLGFHLAYESAEGGALGSIDLRLHLNDTAWLQAGAYGWSHDNRVDAGLGLGLGLEGIPGAIVGAAEVVLGGLAMAQALGGGLN